MNHNQSYHLSVLVLHADPIVCAGVVSALREHAMFDVSVDCADDPALDGRRIDVAILDYDGAMQRTSPGARGNHDRLAGARILALTANDREADIRRALRNGIHGYLLLGGSLDELVDAVGAVGMGVRYVCPIVAQRLADSLAGEALTQRENEVLRLVATGQSNKAIAKELTIELGTVKSHVSAIMTKLGAMSRTQAANIAVTRGLVDQRALQRTATRAGLAPAVDVQPQFA